MKQRRRLYVTVQSQKRCYKLGLLGWRSQDWRRRKGQAVWCRNALYELINIYDFEALAACFLIDLLMMHRLTVFFSTLQEALTALSVFAATCS